MIFAVSWATWVLLCLMVAALTIIFYSENSKDSKTEAPGPRRWPIIGSIPYMAKFTNTIDAFSAIAREYGDIATLQLGSVNAIVVSGVDNIREILVTRAQVFDSRPGFTRFDMLFEGDRNNSIAFADWSENQKKRREIVGHHSFPKKATPRFDIYQSVAAKYITEMVDNLKSTIESDTNENKSYYLKRHLVGSTLRTFLKYFCGFEKDSKNQKDLDEFQQTYDDIFQEVNTPCIGDIFPAIMPVCKKSHLRDFGEPIRKFMIKHCVEPRLAKIENVDWNNNETQNVTSEPKIKNLLDEFMSSIGKDTITEDTALYALEDMIGGHAATGNMLTTVCLFLAQNPKVQAKVRKEVSEVSRENQILLTDDLSYTEAVVWEAVRHIGSPLVPHVANQDTHLGDFPVKKGTVLFLNNGDLNSSPSYWTEPEKFEPERFLKGGQVLKPDHYFPFGTGRRSCLGFKLLMYTSILIVANLCTSFELGLDLTESYKWQLGSLAVPGDGFKFTLKPMIDDEKL